MEFSLAHRIPVAHLAYLEIEKISISCINYSRKREIWFKNLSLNQQNLNHDGIYSCTGIYFFKSAFQFWKVKEIFQNCQENHVVDKCMYLCNNIFDCRQWTYVSTEDVVKQRWSVTGWEHFTRTFWKFQYGSLLMKSICQK